MPEGLQKKLEEIENVSSLGLNETLLLLTGEYPTQIEYSGQNTHPPVPDIRYIKMRKTQEYTWPKIKGKQGGGHIIHTKGTICFVDKKLAKHYIKKGWGEDQESSSERKKN